MKRALAILGAVVVTAIIAVWAAVTQWNQATNSIVRQLGSPLPPGYPIPDSIPIDSLPQPVRRYVAKAIGGSAPIKTAQINWAGTFLTKPATGGWSSFRAKQWYSTEPPGFLWDARIGMGPGMKVCVRDGFVDQAGRMSAAAMCLVSVVQSSPSAALNAAALHRYLAETVWFPSALVSRYVRWTALTDSTARATIRVDQTEVSLEFRFGRDSLITSAFAESRYRDVNGVLEPTPWEGRYYDYRRDQRGLWIPSRAEVDWVLPGKRLTYWRGTATSVEYDRPLNQDR